jgi:acetyl esterase/lipase
MLGGGRLLLRCLVLACLPALAACAGAAVAGSAPVTPLATVALPAPVPRFHAELRPDLPYGPYAAQVLDLCMPAGATGSRPGVVLIHGGAWMHGDKLRWRSLCLQLAAQGFVAASIDYRLAPEWPWPAQLVDAQLAVRWLRAQASSLGLDARHLCAYGDSAGGHLAVFLGVLHSIHAGDLAAALTAQSPAVSCVVDDFGPTDLVSLALTPLGQQIAGPLFGGKTSQSDPALYRDASPVFAVTSASAPMLLLQGTRDGVVPASQSAELARALHAQHVPVQYVTYDGDHEFDGLPAAEQRALLDLTIAFLVANASP